MASAIAVLVLIAALVSAYWWTDLQNKGVRPRAMRTSASVDQVAEAFDAAVAGMGWKVVDPSNPRIAQSPLLSGIRQRIAMTYGRNPDGRLSVVIAPIRISKKGLLFRRPTKAHTLRMRMNGFERRVTQVDPLVQILDPSSEPDLAQALSSIRTIS